LPSAIQEPPAQPAPEHATTLRLLRHYRHLDTPAVETCYTLLLIQDAPFTEAQRTLIREALAIADPRARREPGDVH